MEGTKIRLWKKTNKDGKTYLSGPMSEVTRLIVVENHRKADTNEPDYYAYIVPNRGPGRLPGDIEASLE